MVKVGNGNVENIVGGWNRCIDKGVSGANFAYEIRQGG